MPFGENLNLEKGGSIHSLNVFSHFLIIFRKVFRIIAVTCQGGGVLIATQKIVLVGKNYKQTEGGESLTNLKRLIRKLGKIEAASRIGVTVRCVNYWLSGKNLPESKTRLIKSLLKEV